MRKALVAIIAVLLIAVVSFASVCNDSGATPTPTPTVALTPTPTPTQEPLSLNLTVHFIDVGQGDAILVDLG